MLCFDNSTEDKSFQDAVDFGNADPALIAVIKYIDRAMHSNGKHATVTSFLRKEGVHATGRAADLRSREFEDRYCIMIAGATNKKFPRKDEYLTVLYHDSGQGKHFHVQVPIEGYDANV